MLAFPASHVVLSVVHSAGKPLSGAQPAHGHVRADLVGGGLALFLPGTFWVLSFWPTRVQNLLISRVRLGFSPACLRTSYTPWPLQVPQPVLPSGS